MNNKDLKHLINNMIRYCEESKKISTDKYNIAYQTGMQTGLEHILQELE